jgi:predicted GNAT family N-acyltransferase
MNLVEHTEKELTVRQFRSIVGLLQSVWPSKDKTADEIAAEYMDRDRVDEAEDSNSKRFVLWEDDQAVAHALTFEREICTTGGSVKQMALAAVCVAENRRGEQLGAQVTRKALGRVDEGVWPLSLFQTPVPGFYEKLGARIVDNEFVNSKNEEDPQANPWWEAEVMIYPAEFAWPEGRIDLNGGGY